MSTRISRFLTPSYSHIVPYTLQKTIDLLFNFNRPQTPFSTLVDFIHVCSHHKLLEVNAIFVLIYDNDDLYQPYGWRHRQYSIFDVVIYQINFLKKLYIPPPPLPLPPPLPIPPTPPTYILLIHIHTTTYPPNPFMGIFDEDLNNGIGTMYTTKHWSYFTIEVVILWQ